MYLYNIVILRMHDFSKLWTTIIEVVEENIISVFKIF